MNKMEQIRGTLYGSAFGDAYGYVTEFSTYQKIVERQPLPPKTLRISDDTQMSIYTIQALQEIQNTISLTNISTDKNIQDRCRKVFADYYMRFYYDDDNNRAPGTTCMSSLRKYGDSDKKTGWEGSSGNKSKGCGTIMRSPWIGLFGNLSREQIFVLALLQSQTTHGHEISWLVSGIASVLVHDIINDNITETDDTRLISQALTIVNYYSELWSNLGYSTKTIKEVKEEIIDILETHVFFKNYEGDPTAIYGEGWTADEALYTSLATVSLYLDDPYNGVKRLVYTNGDSDSIASIGGAFLGALNNYDSFEFDIVNNLETRYQKEIEECFSIIVETHN